MKLIELTQGKFSKIDDEDFDRVSQYNWHLAKWGYAATYGFGRGNAVYLHNFVKPVENGYFNDHINGDKLDNQKSNLRQATHQQNCQARQRYSNNTSGYKGVSWFKNRSQWRAYIYVDKRQVFLGWFNDPRNAAKCYNEAAKKHFGEFATLNNV